MKRRHRLTKRGDFVAARKLRATVSEGVVRMHAAPNGNLPMRVGFAISKIKSAVTRNRLRRQLRVAMSAHIANLQGLDVVISLGPPAIGSKFAQLTKEIDNCVERLPQMVNRRQTFSRIHELNDQN